MNIILLGAPGSGKGTMSELLIDKMNMIQLSTGDLFRKNIAENTPLGIQAKKYISEGKYVPDSVTNGMVQQFLSFRSDHLIFDGYPRTIEQANALDEMLLTLGHQIDKVFLIDIDKSILHDRLVGRMVCPTCKRSYHKITRKPKVEWICDYDKNQLVVRPDDVEDKIETRLKEYEALTEPLIDYYEEQNKLVKIKATNLLKEELFEEIKKEMI